MSTVTVLTSTWDAARAYKYWPAHATAPEDYKLSTHFDGAEIPCSGISDLWAILQDLQDEARTIIVRGGLNPATSPPYRRSVHGIDDDDAGLVRAESHLVVLDIDTARPEVPGFEAGVRWVLEKLGAPWSTSACVAQATGKCGLPDFRCRLWFWSDRGISAAELRARLRGLPVAVDVSVCMDHQPIYTAPPQFEDPGIDPFPDGRLFLLPGSDTLDIFSVQPVEAVDVPLDLPAVKLERQWTRMELLGCDREADKWEKRLETCTADRPNLLLKAASRLARLVAHGWSSRDEVETRLVGAYAQSYADETIGGTREAGMDEDTYAEALRLIGRGFTYAASNPEIIKPPKGLNASDVKKAKSERGSAVKAIKDNAALLGVFTPAYANQVQKGIITPERAVIELRDALIEAGVGGAAAQERAEASLAEATQQAEKEDNAKWMEGLAMTDKGEVRDTFANHLSVLAKHPGLRGCMYYNLRTKTPIVEKPFPWLTPGPLPRPLDDRDVCAAATWLASTDVKLYSSRKQSTWEALLGLARQSDRDPFKEYLESLEWDGESRLAHWLTDIAGVEWTPYVGAVSLKCLVGAVARTMDPGCQVDNMLVMEGHRTGEGKTSLIRELVPSKDMYGYLDGSTADKDTVLTIHGPVLVEMAEMHAIRSWEVQKVKGFLSRTVDRVRPPYGRVMETMPRSCIFIGTTNEYVYLQDHSGNRRFWPVTVGNIDRTKLAQLRDQLWAEATCRYLAGDQWWLTEAEEELAREEQDLRREVDPMEIRIETLLSRKLTEKQRTNMPDIEVDDEGRPTSITSQQVAALLPNFVWDRAGQTAIGKAMQVLKWKMRRVGKDKKRVYFRP